MLTVKLKNDHDVRTRPGYYVEKKQARQRAAPRHDPCHATSTATPTSARPATMSHGATAPVAPPSIVCMDE